MPTAEKIVLGLIVFGGFFWLRTRARSMDLARSKGRVVFGICGVLIALLIGAKKLFENWPGGPLVLKAALLASCFAAVGFLFLRPGPPGGEPSEDGSPPLP